eukprot:13851236-Alexandrium_andersonii.AAC.1
MAPKCGWTAPSCEPFRKHRARSTPPGPLVEKGAWQPGIRLNHVDEVVSEACFCVGCVGGGGGGIVVSA